MAELGRVEGASYSQPEDRVSSAALKTNPRAGFRGSGNEKSLADVYTRTQKLAQVPL